MENKLITASTNTKYIGTSELKLCKTCTENYKTLLKGN